MILDYTSNAAGLPFVQEIYQDFSAELQWSSDYMVSIVLEGNLSIHYANHTRRFSTHDIYFFKPFSTYSYASASKDARVLTLAIDSDYIRKLCPASGSLEPTQHHLYKNLSNPVYDNICRNFATIIFNNLKTEVCSRMKLLDAANAIIIDIFENFCKEGNNSNSSDFASERIISILEYINEHYSEKITVTDIAKSLGIHPQYFSTFFNKHFQTNFADYLSTFRINKSLERLVYSNDSILDIALDFGFSSHKTYASAFRKLYNMTPREYKKKNMPSPVSTPEKEPPHPSFNEFGLFSFFRQFLHRESFISENTKPLQIDQTITLDVAELGRHSHSCDVLKFVSAGRTFACLRSDFQEQLRRAKDELHYEYIRLRDIFSDDLYVYYENNDHEPIYSWQALDSVFDFILSIGAKPFPEIGFTPRHLASRSQYAGWQYHPNVSLPKSMQKWQDLVRAFLVHCIDRYGLKEIRSWYFDFWTCPDLKIKLAYWNESMEEFFDFYKATYETFKSVDSELRLGSPNFSTLSGYDWYNEFFQYCFINKIYPSYVSAHIYGNKLKDNSRELAGFTNIEGSSFSVSNPNYVEECLTNLHHIMNRHGFRNLDVIVSDWNLTFLPADYVRDTCYMGPYIANTLFNTLGKAKGMCFWSLSDIHEDFFPENQMFRGGPGLLDYHGLRKASYNTFMLLNRMGSRILDKGDNYLFTRDKDIYQLFIYNLIEFDYMYAEIDNSGLDSRHRYNIYNNNDDIHASIMVNLPKGRYYIKRYEVNRQHGSAYDIWEQMGTPEVLSKDMEDYIQTTSQPHISYSFQEVDSALLLDATIPAHGVILIEIIPG